MRHSFQINLRGIIDLLSEHLYSSPDVFVRELIQNAVDALTARKAIEPDFAGEIAFERHSSPGKPTTLCVSDNGIGLTTDEVHRFLSTIGKSSKRAADGKRTGDFIGQFGIGILSAFVVCDEIVLITKSAADPAAKPVEWRALVDGTYTLKELEREISPGTQVWLTAKEIHAERFEADYLIDRIRHYGILLPYPVRFTNGRSTQTLNGDAPPWRQSFSSDRKCSEAMLEFGTSMFDSKFFDAIPIKIETGSVEGIAFVLPFAPSLGRKQSQGHRVYLRGMLLTESAENLLPEWAFFVRAIINANDLRPTASRESFYEDTKLKRVREAIGQAIRTYLMRLADERPEKMKQFITLHHRALKALAVEDDEFFNLIIDMLPFETTSGTQPMGEYRRSNDKIRYTADVDTFRQISRVATAQGLCVINAGYTYDAELINRLAEIPDGPDIEVVDPRELALSFEDLPDDIVEVADQFIDDAERVLRPFRASCDVKRFQPVELPCLISSSAEGRFMRSLEQSKEIANPLWSGVLNSLGKREQANTDRLFLCFNESNALVRRLIAAPSGPRKTRSIQMLYIQSLLLGHHPLSSRELALLNEGLMGLIEESTN